MGLGFGGRRDENDLPIIRYVPGIHISLSHQLTVLSTGDKLGGSLLGPLLSVDRGSLARVTPLLLLLFCRSSSSLVCVCVYDFCFT